MRIHRALGLMACFLTSSVAAFGWNDLGHMAVAYQAYQQLNRGTRSRVDALLKLNPDYGTWLTKIPQGTSARSSRMMLFMLAATWPDHIKKEPGYTNDACAPADPISSQNIGYSDTNQHRCWHYKDTYFSDDGSPLPPESTPNAETQIGLFRAVLASDQPDELKSYDLVWLLHLVGDLHQPLHATSRVTQIDPQGDEGGNKEEVCTPTCGHKLHAFWDDVLGKSTTPSAAMRVGRTLPSPPPAQANDLTTATWVKESFDLARQSVYAAPIGAGNGPFTLTASYRQAAKSLARQQVALAGARLANLLNRELK